MDVRYSVQTFGMCLKTDEVGVWRVYKGIPIDWMVIVPLFCIQQRLVYMRY